MRAWDCIYHRVSIAEE